MDTYFDNLSNMAMQYNDCVCKQRSGVINTIILNYARVVEQL